MSNVVVLETNCYYCGNMETNGNMSIRNTFVGNELSLLLNQKHNAMKRKLILMLSALLVMNAVHAQWHFTANIDYYCNGENHDLEVYQWQIQLAKQLSATAFNTKQECETARQSITIHVGVPACWIKITPSPCTGSDIGGSTGGVMGGDLGIGGGSQGSASSHNSIAIGQSYFSPNETQVVANTGRDLEIKLEAMSKGFNSAVNGIKTGDQAFDDCYQRQVRYAYEREESENKDSDYYSALNKVRAKNALDKVRVKSDGDLETSKYKEGIQKHLNNTLNGENEPLTDKVVGAVSNSIDNIKVGSRAVKTVTEGYKQHGEAVPKSELIDDLNNGINAGGIISKAFFGDKEGYKQTIKEKLFDSSIDVINNLGNTWTNTKDWVKKSLGAGKITLDTQKKLLPDVKDAVVTQDTRNLQKTMDKLWRNDIEQVDKTIKGSNR